jgi:hypothetical protein
MPLHVIVQAISHARALQRGTTTDACVGPSVGEDRFWSGFYVDPLLNRALDGKYVLVW